LRSTRHREVGVAGGDPVELTTARVLLVDDEDGVRWVTASVLRRLGYQVLEASTGTEGLRIAREQAGTLDLLLTDVRMGEVSGFEVASAFREANPDRPVIFTSGYGGQEMLRTAERAGGVFLEKPYDISRLARAVQDALTGGQRLDSLKEARE
jgi:two-component system cell cycle sensor histidine kinase/response regulator CckA